MKAELNAEGILTFSAESETEYYALKQWLNNLQKVSAHHGSEIVIKKLK